MTNSKFFNFVKSNEDAELYITGTIVDNDSAELYEAFGFDCTAPANFKKGLDELDGRPLTVYIDSYGGDVLVASSIYTMLREYKGKVTVKVDSIAASAASVIAMAGDKVLMSPTAYLMIHDPSTIVAGNITEVKQGLDALKSIKEGIINAYQRKSNLSREKISKLMTDETWLDYNKALEYGFIDGEIGSEKLIVDPSVLDTIRNQKMAIYNMVTAQKPNNRPTVTPTSEVTDNADGVAINTETPDTGKIKAELEMLDWLKLKSKR